MKKPRNVLKTTLKVKLAFEKKRLIQKIWSYEKTITCKSHALIFLLFKKTKLNYFFFNFQRSKKKKEFKGCFFSF